MTDKAIIIKGPSADAKSYFTELPNTLDELVQKAGRLFPVPPNHSAHLLLEGGAILMPDVLPFLKDREILTFKWTANTPRSSLRQTMRTAEELGSSGGSSSGESGRSSRAVRWDASVLSNEDRTSKDNATLSATSSESVRPYRYSASARAEHSKRVLNEQEQRRRSEQSKEDIFSSHQPSAALPDDSNKAGAEPNRSPQTARHNETEENSAHLTTSNVLGTPPSAFHAKGGEHERIHSDEEQQNSSPIASPTRNIRGAQKSKNEWTTPLGSEKVVDFSAPKAGERSGKSSALSDNATSAKTSTDVTEQKSTALTAAEAASPKSPKRVETDKSVSSKNEVRAKTAYQRMKSVIEALRSHPSNQYFRLPLSAENSTTGDFVTFLRQTNRAVLDFPAILDKVSKEQYGQDDPYVGFAADLTQMWSNTRSFYGPASPQAQCADFLDRFSRIITVEWRRDDDTRPESKIASDNKQHAMARAAKLLHNMTYGAAAPTKSSSTKRVAAIDPKRSVPVSTTSLRESSTQTNALTQTQPHDQKSKTSPSRLGNQQTHQQQRMQDTKMNDVAFTPRTQAFLSSMFAKGNGAIKPTSASADMMAKLQQQFGPISVSNAAGRKTISPNNRFQLYTMPGTPTKQHAGIKRAAVTSIDDQRSLKRANTEEGVQKDLQRIPQTHNTIPMVSVTQECASQPASSQKATATPAAAVTATEKADTSGVRTTEKISPRKTSEASKDGKRQSEDESAVEAVTASQSPPSVAKRVRERLESPTSNASAQPTHSDSPRRRSPRRSTLTAKAKELKQSGSTPTSKTTTVAPKMQHPQRMMTRGVAATVMGTPRRGRMTAAM